MRVQDVFVESASWWGMLRTHNSLHHFKQSGFFNRLRPLGGHTVGEWGSVGEGSLSRAQGHTGKWLPYI